MLAELHIENLGIIRSATLQFEKGFVVFSGETGAGKTMLIEAIELVVGGRAEATMVGPHGSEARVEGRFVRRDGAHSEDEVVLARVVPADGRSRAYVNGRLATATVLSEIASDLIDIHGQHAHQRLLSINTQRGALDTYGQVDLGPVEESRAALVEIDASLAALGGDDRERAREMDLLRFQRDEIADANLADPDEDRLLEAEEERLASIVAYREALQRAVASFDDDGGLATIREGLKGLQPFTSLADVAARLGSALTEMEDLSRDLHRLSEEAEENPARLAEIRSRRQLLRDLMRKYGDNLAAVMEYGATAEARLSELESWAETAQVLSSRRSNVLEQLARAEEVVGAARRAAAPSLGAAVRERLRDLGMPNAELRVEVGSDRAGNDVQFLFSANPGLPLLPLTRVASGGELARAMLALRLVLVGEPSALVFDEVDAGIGGSAAVAVARSLAELGAAHQVFAVTHLAQVAAAATSQILVEKSVDNGLTIGTARILNAAERTAEIARMLSGGLADDAAREHASRLLLEMSSVPAPRESSPDLGHG